MNRNFIKQNSNKAGLLIKTRTVFLLLVLLLVGNASFAQLKIILKLDDISAKNSSLPASATLDYIVAKKIKASIGAVANKFDGSALSIISPYLNAANLNGEKLFEIWHHGLDHIDPEFSGTGYTYQKTHFDSASQVIKNYLRIQMHSFGAPFNHSDTNTNKVMSEDANYKVCMFNDITPPASILNLTNRVNMENGTGNPDYAYFENNYNTYKTVYTDYMVLQGHPNVWTPAHLAQFSRIIDSLIVWGCEFVTPYGYYLSLNPSVILPSTAQTISFNSLPSKLLGDADFNAGATASSGLPVSYNSSNAAVATIVNGNIHIVGAGTVIITASQAGNATYKAADYVSQTLTVNAIDYRSAVVTGNWNTASSWEARNADGSWSTATAIPTAINNVYIQNGHAITVNIANAYCNDLHFNTAGVLTVASNIVNVSGKIRAYTGTAVTGSAATDGTFYSGQTSTTTLVAAMVTTTTGVIKFVGASRNITNAGEWNGAGTSNNVEFALDADAIGVLGTSIKFKTITLSGGTVTTGFTINVGSTSGNGVITIKNGTKLVSSRTYTAAGSQAITYSSTSKTGTVSIETGGILEFTGASPVIDCTTFTNNGTVVYSGTAQTLLQAGGGSGINITSYNNLTVSGSGTKTLSTATTVAGTLTVSNGRLVTSTNNLTLGGTAVFEAGTSLAITTGSVTDFAGKAVTLKSAASESSIPETAFIEAVTGTLNNATNVTVQQYIPGGYRKYRFLSHPFNAAQPLSQLTDNIDITGNGGTANGFTATATNSASAYSFNTATANGASNDAGWQAFTNATNTSWLKGQGIRVLIRGSKSQPGSLDGSVYAPNAVTLDMTGAINTGNVAINLSAAGTGSSQGFNLVGNPYPSPVDIGAVLTTASNIGNSFYVRNPQTGSYITVNPIPVSYMLPANSAFFTVASATTNLNFTEANKNACANCATVFRNNSSQAFIQLKAFKNGLEYDNLYVYLDSQYKSSYDKKDAIKLTNDGLNLYTLSSDNQKLAADYRNVPTGSTIPMGIALPASYGKQVYILQVSDYDMLPDITMYLHDKLKNSYTTIRKDATYALDVDPSNTSSVGEDRLEIVLSKEVKPTVTTNAFNVHVSIAATGFLVNYENAEPANTTIKLLNSAGQIIQYKSLGIQQQGQTKFPSLLLPQGLYLIEVQMGNNKVVKKIIK